MISLIVTSIPSPKISLTYSPGSMHKLAKIKKEAYCQVNWRALTIAVNDCSLFGDFKNMVMN